MLYTNRTNQRKPIEIPSCSTIQKDNVCHSFFIYVTKWLQIVVEYDSSRQQLMYDDPVLHRRSSPCASTWQHKSVQFPYLTSLQMQPPLHSMHVWWTCDISVSLQRIQVDQNKICLLQQTDVHDHTNFPIKFQWLYDNSFINNETIYADTL